MAAPAKLALIPLILTASAARAQWTVSILHPTGATQSSALGVSTTQQVGFLSGTSDTAALWLGTAASYLTLHPAGATDSHANAAAATQQVGDAFASGQLRASLWTGSAASWIDLSPTGTFRSVALGTNGVQQVGVARVGLFDHASSWTGTAASWTDLHPAAANNSTAFAVYGNTQVGSAVISNVLHACSWTGSAATFVDLHPTGIGATGSEARAVQLGRIAGYAAGVGGHTSHACYWDGPAFVDLNPAGSTESQALGTSGGIQVGYVRIAGGQSIASLWRNTAASWENLSLFLPGSWVATRAEQITRSGANYLVVGHGFNLATNRREAVLWTMCYANCDGSLPNPVLTANDFQCFLNKYAAGEPYANCDGSLSTPMLTANDFQCFLNAYATGCP